METPTAEQVRTLAPDGSAARAAEALADRRRWSGLGRGGTAAWGVCQGSGSSPYQVAVDLAQVPSGAAAAPAYSCSCPSRKIPCKHALGLLFLLAGGNVEAGTSPAWAVAWLESRAARAAATAARANAADTRTADDVGGVASPAGVDDGAARAKRIAARERKVIAGIDELERWLADLMRRGLDGARGEGYRFWDAMAARLVDAQAASLGRSVRGLGSAAGGGEAWPHVLLEGAARLQLLCEAYRRAGDLPDGLRADVRSLVGWTTKEEDLATGDEVEDRWLVVGRRVDESGQVITARTFLLGETSGRFALHLSFGVDAAPPTVLASSGQALRARLAFYPSATPLRAAVRPVIRFDGEVTALPAAVTIEDALRAHAGRLGTNPFAGAWPVALEDVVPVVREERLLVRGPAGTALPVEPGPLAPRLLAVSGGRPMTLVGEWDGMVLRPLSALAGMRLVGIDAVDGGDAGTASRGPRPGAFRDGDPSWSRLVSAALLGTERTGGTVPVPEQAAGLVGERDREQALLASAAVLAVRRRAGQRPEHDGGPLPTPAPEDDRAALRGEATRLFAHVVTDEPALLGEVLDLLRTSGRRPPDELLPELLTIAARSDEAREAVEPLLGPRARWLAAAVPELAGGIATAPDADWDAAWDEARGGRARGAILRSLRGRDAAASRDALRRWLPGLPGDERVAAIEALEIGLAAGDEPLLTEALVDGRADVRRAAAGLLARLEGSAFTRALEARARPLLAVRGRLRPSLIVTLPALDPELEAAGLAGRPPGGYGERAWLLRQVIAHVRPSRWVEWLGAEPRALLDRALPAGEARPLVEGWAEAATRFGDRDWLVALAGEPRVGQVARVDLARAVASLPTGVRPAVVTAAAPSLDPVGVARLAATCRAPWPAALAAAVLDAARPLASGQFPDPAVYELIRTAARGLPPDRAGDLVEIASWDGQLRPGLAGAIDTIHLRGRIHAAFAALPPVGRGGQP